MAVIAKFSCDGLTPGTTINTSVAGTGDTSWGSINGTAPTAASGGLRSPRMAFNQASGATSYVSWGSGKLGGTRNVWGLRMYVELSAVADSGWTLFSAYMDSTMAMKLAIAGAGGVAGQLRIRDENNVEYGASPIGLQPNVVYRLEILFGNGAVSVTAYVGDGRAVYTKANTNGTVGALPVKSVNKMSFGPLDVTPTVPTFYLDDILLIDTATESGPVGVSSSPSLSIWTGSQEIYLVGSP